MNNKKDSNRDSLSNDIKFSLNNSTELDLTENINSQSRIVEESPKSTPDTERFSKRRRTGTSEKKLPPKPEKKVKKSIELPKIIENQELWTEKYQFKNEDETKYFFFF